MWKNTATDKWVQTGGVAPKPLLEFTFAVQADGKLLTYYDLSAVDGYVVGLQLLHHACRVHQCCTRLQAIGDAQAARVCMAWIPAAAPHCLVPAELASLLPKLCRSRLRCL